MISRTSEWPGSFEIPYMNLFVVGDHEFIVKTVCPVVISLTNVAFGVVRWGCGSRIQVSGLRGLLDSSSADGPWNVQWIGRTESQQEAAWFITGDQNKFKTFMSFNIFCVKDGKLQSGRGMGDLLISGVELSEMWQLWIKYSAQEYH